MKTNVSEMEVADNMNGTFSVLVIRNNGQRRTYTVRQTALQESGSHLRIVRILKTHGTYHPEGYYSFSH